MMCHPDYARPLKQSVTIRGHRTSVSLEPAFWEALKHIARKRTLTRNALVAEIDTARNTRTGLASAIRLYVLDWHRPNDHVDDSGGDRIDGDDRG